MIVPDIYFEQFWGALNAAQDGGTLESFVLEDDLGSVLYRFIKRPTELLPDTFDTITPYGFSGPVILQCEEGRREDLARRFDAAFQYHCREHRLVAEYIRFCPWLRNHEDFRSVYELVHNNYTLGIDLTVRDFFLDEFSSTCRNSIRKAEKLGVSIQFDFACQTVDEFYRLYNLMADKNSISPSYRFSKRYIDDLAEKGRPHLFLMNGILNGTIVSSAMFLQSENHLHYHLCGNDPAFFSCNANNLMISKACEWGRQHGKRSLQLGGAFTDGLFKFKKAFTRNGVFDFFVGRKIRLQETYDQLVAMKGQANPRYFPAYRG